MPSSPRFCNFAPRRNRHRRGDHWSPEGPTPGFLQSVASFTDVLSILVERLPLTESPCSTMIETCVGSSFPAEKSFPAAVPWTSAGKFFFVQFFIPPPQPIILSGWQCPVPRADSTAALKLSNLSFGTNASAVPAKPPPWIRTAPSPKKLLAEGNGEGHVLLFDVAGGGHVLKQRPRRHTGLIDIV